MPIIELKLKVASMYVNKANGIRIANYAMYCQRKNGIEYNKYGNIK